MKTKPLSDPRQEKFVQNLVKGMSQRQAYREAFGSKAQDRTVDNMASRMLKRDEVKMRYTSLTSSAKEKYEKKAEAAGEEATDLAAEIYMGWKKILKANAMDYLTIGVSKTGRIVTELRPDIEGIDGFAIQEISTDSAGNVRLKLYSKTEALKALDDLEQRMGAERSGLKLDMAEELEKYAE